jgi:Flp pilus assembly protein TadD
MTGAHLHTIRRHALPLLLLLVATAVAYGRILGHSFLDWDDTAYVTDIDAIRGFTWRHVRTVFSSYYVGNYAPVQMLSYMLDYTLWGMWAGGFLLSNLLIHAANGILVYRLLLRWVTAPLPAAIGAALFLLHPVQVETVAWVSQRKNLLAMFFFLLAWEGYCRYRAAAPGNGKRLYLGSVFAYVLALLAKSVTVVFPLVLLLDDYFSGDARQRRRLRDKIPYLLAAVGCVAIALHSQGAEFDGGKVAATEYAGDRLGTLLLMLPIFCRYLGMLVWPAHLSADYAPVVHQHLDPVVIGCGLLLLVLGGVGFRLGRAHRPIGFFLLLFWVGILPVSQIVPLTTLMNDRYLYFPLLGAAGVVAAAVQLAQHRSGRTRGLIAGLCITGLLALAVVTYQRAGVWKNTLTLWADAVAKTPGSSRAWGSLGAAHAGARQWDAAQKAYGRGLALNPANDQILYNWGSLSLGLGDFEQATTLISQLLAGNPNHIRGLVAMGDILVNRLNFIDAERHYQAAYRLQPTSAQILAKLGNLAFLEERFDQARNYYVQAEQQAEQDPDLAYQLTCVEAITGQTDAAFHWLEQALRRGYDNGHELRSNRELQPLWADPRFEQLLQRYLPGQ